MPTKKKLPTLIGVIQNLAAILTIISFVSGVIIYYNYNVPSLKYETIPTYYFDELSISGISLRNEGHSTAHEISIFIESSKEIKNYKVVTNEPYKPYRIENNSKNIGIQLDRLVAGYSVNIYLLTDEPPIIKPTITYENGFAEPAISYSTISSQTFWYLVISIVIMLIGAIIYIWYEYHRFENLIEDIRIQLKEKIIDKSEHFTDIDWWALGLASSNLIKKYLKAGEIPSGRTFQYHLVKDLLVEKSNDKIEKNSIDALRKKTNVPQEFVDDLLKTLEKQYELIEIKDSYIKVTDKGIKTFNFVMFYLNVGLKTNMFKPLPDGE